MSKHLISTPATVQTCARRCGALVVHAIAEGLTVEADIQPLTHADLAVALASGRRAFTLQHQHLVDLDETRMATAIARKFVILAAHLCGRPPAKDPTGAPVKTESARSDPDLIPF